MANRLTEVLNSQGMSLTIACAGMSKVGIGIPAISGTSTLVSFFGSLDGLNFLFPLNMTPFPSGTAVSTATATGNFEVPVQNFVAIRVVLTTLGSGGSVTVIMAASIDSSYQDAFLTPTSRFVSQKQSGGTQNALTIAAQANRAWRCRTLTIAGNVAAAAGMDLQITDGASAVLWEGTVPPNFGQGIAGGGTYIVPLPSDPQVPGLSGGGVVGTPGNSMVFTLAAPGGSVISIINAEMEPA